MSDSRVPETQVNPNGQEIADQTQQIIPKKYIIIGIVVLILLFAAIIGLVLLAVSYPVHTQTFRDIAIIALATESGLIGLALIVLIIQLARLVNMLEFEIKPILLNTSDAISTVRGTANFMSDRVVDPMIRASGYASGLTSLVGSIRGLVGLGRTASSKEADINVESLKERNHE